MRQRREAVAASLQQRHRRAAKRRQDKAVSQSNATQFRQAGTQQHGQHDGAGHEVAREDQIGAAKAAHDPGSRGGERQRCAERHGAPDRNPQRSRFALRAVSVVCATPWR
jgi:hypothetical protein